MTLYDMDNLFEAVDCDTLQFFWGFGWEPICYLEVRASQTDLFGLKIMEEVIYLYILGFLWYLQVEIIVPESIMTDMEIICYSLFSMAELNHLLKLNQY
jgi:hypothetical protein